MNWLLLLVVLLHHLPEKATGVRLVRLTALKCGGKLRPPSSDTDVAAAFLSKGKLEVLESEDDEEGDAGSGSGSNEAILCDVMPVPLFDARGKAMVTELLTNPASYDKFAVAPYLVNRDGGIYDALPWAWKGKGAQARLDFYKLLQQVRVDPRFKGAPERAFFTALEDQLDAVVTGLFFEVRDELASDRVSLGSALVVARTAVAAEWRLSLRGSGLPTASSTDPDIRDHDACVVTCTPDELVALSAVLDLPIYMPEELFDSSAVDARLINYGSDDDDGNGGESSSNMAGKMTIYAPVFRSAQQRTAWERQGSGRTAPSSRPDIRPAWEIFDAKTFFGMSSAEKRATLRASGVTSLPRPREGLDSLDRALVDKMDDAVRAEVLRMRAAQQGAPLLGGNAPASGRQAVLQQLAQALEDGDVARAESLREKFVLMTERRADPTQQEGTYDRFLDQDEWYQEQRRRAMAPKPPKKD